MSGTRADARKRLEDTPRVGTRDNVWVRERQRRREVMQQALAEVYPGAEFVDADALLDQLADLGASVEVSG